VPLRVLTWNLMHGRSLPSAGRDLMDEFAAALAGWEWDAALLQEVPPWWPAALGVRLGAERRTVLTSRNALLPLRQAVAVRWPDVIKSNGGGSNAILVRGETIADHRTFRLCVWPERRQLHGVRLASGCWIANLHATVHDDAAARRDADRARLRALAWADGSPLVLGGDFNVRTLSLPGLAYAGGHDVDLVFVAGFRRLGDVEVLERGSLSDHAPVRVTVG
jgi:endonuclease/exonuclease/phosphatase family metal-dependent hydrolase